MDIFENLFNYKQNLNKKKDLNFDDHVLFNNNVSNQDMCPICFEDFSVGDIASILPCHHIFHRQCITPWLKKSNSCPNCRIDYGYQQDSLNQIEIDRRTRQNKENIFFGKNCSVDTDLINHLSVKKLKFLLDEFSIDYSKCIQKDELKNLAFNEIFMLNKTIDELKRFLIANNIDISDCLEKKELLKLIASIQLIKRVKN